MVNELITVPMYQHRLELEVLFSVAGSSVGQHGGLMKGSMALTHHIAPQ